ncbi:MAG: DNA polymerase III subunit, partial [Dehalococcoidia bacterium]|nr:DNA polymerase III subunit [Dehalococcoidia bacterium]
MWNIIGQDKAITALEGAMRTGHLSHAYLIVGPPKAGKGTLAVRLAQALNCTGETPPCEECKNCRRIVSGKHADVITISLLNAVSEEGSSRKEIGIDSIKRLQNDAYLPPFEGKRKVFIIDGAEYLSQPAANCLLKTLEEPPPGVTILLVASREEQLLPTIVSRCQRIELLPVPSATLQIALEEGYSVGTEQARLLSILSRGCPGWALAAIADSDFLEAHYRQVSDLIALEEAGIEQRFAAAAKLTVNFSQQREKVDELLVLWLNWWHDVLLVSMGVRDFISHINLENVLEERARLYTMEEINKFLSRLRETRQYLEWNVNPRLVMEVLMLEL